MQQKLSDRGECRGQAGDLSQAALVLEGVADLGLEVDVLLGQLGAELGGQG